MVVVVTSLEAMCRNGGGGNVNGNDAGCGGNGGGDPVGNPNGVGIVNDGHDDVGGGGSGGGGAFEAPTAEDCV